MIFIVKYRLKYLVSFIIFFLIFNRLSAQKFTISGYVKDAASDETIIAANISVIGKNSTIISNQYGFYSITLTKGIYQITTSHVGYRASTFKIDLSADTSINISLNSGTALSEEVVVYSAKRENNVKGAQMGKITLPIEQIKSVPAFLGEVDLL